MLSRLHPVSKSPRPLISQLASVPRRRWWSPPHRGAWRPGHCPLAQAPEPRLCLPVSAGCALPCGLPPGSQRSPVPGDLPRTSAWLPLRGRKGSSGVNLPEHPPHPLGGLRKSGLGAHGLARGTLPAPCPGDGQVARKWRMGPGARGGRRRLTCLPSRWPSGSQETSEHWQAPLLGVRVGQWRERGSCGLREAIACVPKHTDEGGG